MNALATLPDWVLLTASLLLITGSTLTLIGAFGLLQLKSFYDRLHAPTLGTSWGTASILLASILCWSWVQERLYLHDLVIAICIVVTTPVTLILLGRAALHRDRAEGLPEVMAAPGTAQPAPEP